MSLVIISNDETIKKPAHYGDVGFDLVAASDPVIVGKKVMGDSSPYWEAIDYIEYDTELKIEPPEGVFSLVFPRSSISKKNLLLANSVGVIDNAYRGNIKIRFKYAAQPRDFSYYGSVGIENPYPVFHAILEVDYDKIYAKGERIAQLVFSNSVIPELKLGQVSDTVRSDSGFGSTGK